MTELFGIDLAGAIGDAFDGQMLTGTLRKTTVTGRDQYGDPTTTTTDYAVQGFKGSYDAITIATAGIPATDAKITLFASLCGAVPTMGDKLQLEGEWYQIRQDIARDPANATYTFPAFKVALGAGVGGVPLLVDTFERADTVAPALGVPSTTGGFSTASAAWLMYGDAVGTPAAPGPASGGHIASGRYVSNAGEVVYAVQHMAGKVTRMGAVVSFADGGGTDEFGSLTLISSKDDKIIHNAVHFVIHRAGITFSVIEDSTFTQLDSLSYGGDHLAKDGSQFLAVVEIDEADNYTLYYAGQTKSGNSAGLAALAGSYFSAELFDVPGTSVDSLARAESLFAATASPGQVWPEIELIPDPTFSDGSKWAVAAGGANWSIDTADHAAIKSAGAEGSLVTSPEIVPVIGATYLVSYTFYVNAGAFLVGFGGANGTVRTASGSYSDTITAVDATGLTFYGNSDADGVLVNYSCRRIF
jgi:hypothetical protein